MIRDEIARALHRADLEPRRFDPHWIVHEWDEISDEARDYWYRLADAILRIVERAVRDAAWEGANEHATNGRTTMSAIGAIVARVMDGGQ